MRRTYQLVKERVQVSAEVLVLTVVRIRQLLCLIEGKNNGALTYLNCCFITKASLHLCEDLHNSEPATRNCPECHNDSRQAGSSALRETWR